MPARKKTVPVKPERKEGKPMAATSEKDFTKVIIKGEDETRYTLEFNSRVVKRMQRNGFKIDSDLPNLMIEELVTGAFQMHHKNITPDNIMKIWGYQSKKEDLLGVLIKLYMKPLEDLMADPGAEDESADPTWETA